MIDLIGPNIQSFSKLLNHPISEKYTLIPASKEETYILTYHSSRLESITGRYYYPYMTDSDNNKLHVEYSYDPQNLNAGCIFALIYHTYTAILSSFVIGLAVATISGKSFWICMGMSFVFVMLIIVLLLNRVKKTLLKQLL